MRWLKILSMSVAAGVLLGFVAACFGVWAWQAHLVFYPRAEVETTPGAFGAKFEEVSIPVITPSGTPESLDGWWIPAEPDAKALIYLHGNGDNIGANAAHAVRLHSLGLAVLIFDYRGYGRSTGGFPSETKVYADAETAWKYLVEKRGFRPEHIFIYGHSLGGAVAIELAMHHPGAAGLIVESSLTSIADMGRRLPMFRWLPVDLLVRERFRSISKVGSLKIPVLFLHGTSDRTVPSQMSQQLYAAAPEPKQLVLVPGGHHADCATVGGSLYMDAVRGFVAQTPVLRP
jgi:alpha-beta hydrolase superfamily lysophospholipase